jgi:hypothetical protein
MYRLNPVQALKSRSTGEIGGDHLNSSIIHQYDLDVQSLIRRHRPCANKYKMASDLGGRVFRLIVDVHAREVGYGYRCRDPDNCHGD